MIIFICTSLHEFKALNNLNLGTTLLMAILDSSSSTLWVANIGDSRGVLCNSSSVPIGEVMPLSYDHKPSQVNSSIKI